jgi:hypothetical protein
VISDWLIERPHAITLLLLVLGMALWWLLGRRLVAYLERREKARRESEPP